MTLTQSKINKNYEQLDKLTIDDLTNFFDDEDNVSHLSGIFLIGY